MYFKKNIFIFIQVNQSQFIYPFVGEIEQVILQIAFLMESFPADVTLVRLIIQVRPSVRNEG